MAWPPCVHGSPKHLALGEAQTRPASSLSETPMAMPGEQCLTSPHFLPPSLPLEGVNPSDEGVKGWWSSSWGEGGNNRQGPTEYCPLAREISPVQWKGEAGLG